MRRSDLEASAGASVAAVPDTLRVGDDEVRFRDYRPGDETQIVDVLRSAFGSFYPSDKPVDEAGYIRWFMEPHGSHRTRTTLAEVGGRVVCVVGQLTRDIKLGSRTLHGDAGGIGTATHPDFQGRGISGARERWHRATEDPPTEASVDTRNLGTRGQRSAPVPSSGEMGVYLFVRRPWLAARARTARDPLTLSVLPASAAALWGGLRSRVGGGAAEATLRTVQIFDERFEPLLEQASAAWDVIPMRSVEYLNWRFCDPRAGAFIVRAAEANGELLGYCVVHAVASRGHLVDALALPERLDVVRTLIADAVRQLVGAGCAAVECWMLREHPYARVLRQAGFVRLRGRSAQVAGEVGWYGTGIGPEEQALLASPDTRTHLVRADFDGI